MAIRICETTECLHILKISLSRWLQIVNNKITKEFPQDSPLILTDNTNEYTSVHTYVNHEGVFTMYHFWIDLSLTR